MTLPVAKKEFWKYRLYNALAFGKELHTAIYDIKYSLWVKVQEETRDILKKYTTSTSSILDAGCGYGAIYDFLDSHFSKEKYVGVDLSEDLLEIGRLRNPKACLLRIDLTDLSAFSDQQFDIAVLRSIEAMLVKNDETEMCQKILTEVSRVAKTVLIIEYDIAGPGVVTHYLLRK